MSYYPHWTVETCLSHGGCYYDEEKAERAIEFIETEVYHQKGKWRGTLLKLEEWQKEIVRMIFGVLEDDTGLRRFTEVSAWLPRKQSKTTFSAAIALYALGWAGEQGGEVYMGAPTRKQAAIIYEFATYNATEVQGAIYRTCVKKLGSITHLESGSIFSTTSSDADTVHGFNPSVAVVDEIHKHKNKNLYEAFKTGQAAREEPLIINISTAGTVNTFGHSQFINAEKVLRGLSIQRTLLPVIYGVDPSADPFDEETWKEAMPNYGVSVFKRNIQAEAAKAKADATYLNSFLNLYLNIWVSSDEAWMQPATWAAARREIPELGGHKGRPRAWFGFDLSVQKDLTTLSVIVEARPRTEDSPPLNHVYCVGFIPEHQVADKAKNEITNLYDLIRRGKVVVIPGPVIDPEYVRSLLLDLTQVYEFGVGAYDAYGAKLFAKSLENDGFQLEELNAGMAAMSEPTKMFESHIIDGSLVHDGCELLSWFVGNVQLERDGYGRVRPSKKASRNKIDGAISSVIAFGAWYAEHYEEEKPTDYFDETGEILFINE